MVLELCSVSMSIAARRPKKQVQIDRVIVRKGSIIEARKGLNQTSYGFLIEFVLEGLPKALTFILRVGPPPARKSWFEMRNDRFQAGQVGRGHDHFPVATQRGVVRCVEGGDREFFFELHSSGAIPRKRHRLCRGLI